MELAFRAQRVIMPAGERAASVGVDGGRIVAVEPLDAELPARRVVDLSDDEVLLPGLVDTHVHVNDPGRSEWEGFETATRAAAAGGVTTLVDMPLNSVPPTVDVAALEAKRHAAAGQVHVDVGFWGGAVPGNVPDLRALHDAGVCGFKCFLLPSGVPEFEHLSTDDLVRALAELQTFDGLMLVHAEADAAVEAAHGARYSDFMHSRPPEAELHAVVQLIDAARSTGARAHVVHLSTGDAVAAIAAARRDGVRLSAETCPHYLTFAAEEIPDGATHFKCCPPIRDAANREALWRALTDGAIDCVVSDHSPCPPELKRLDTGDFGQAWGGISGLQLGLPAVWTGARPRDVPLTDVVRWMAERPATLAGLQHKGQIAHGFDADLCVFAPDEAFVVDAAQLRHRHRLTPYDGRRLHGVVRSTWLRGAEVDGEARGRLLRRDR